MQPRLQILAVNGGREQYIHRGTVLAGHIVRALPQDLNENQRLTAFEWLEQVSLGRLTLTF